MKILKIFEGVDRVGKSTSMTKLKKHYEDQNLKVLSVHDDNDGLMLTKEEFDLINKIPDVYEKAIMNLEAYAYFIKRLFNNYDVILIDRLHLTPKVYADVNRPGSIERVFGTIENFRTYFTIFEDVIKRIPESEIELLVFTKIEGSKYEDDTATDRWHQSAEKQLLINEAFVKLLKHTTLNHKHFICEADSAGYYNTYEQLLKHITTNA